MIMTSIDLLREQPKKKKKDSSVDKSLSNRLRLEGRRTRLSSRS